MARHERDREDLLAEATALVERVELCVAGAWPQLVAGFRRDGCLSLYFGAAPAYHFNTRGELRRAYAGGRLYAARQGRLAALTRQRSPGQVALVEHRLNAAEQEAFLSEAASRLELLRRALEAASYSVLRQVPAEGRVADRLHAWLEKLPQRLAVAAAPHAC